MNLNNLVTYGAACFDNLQSGFGLPAAHGIEIEKAWFLVKNIDFLLEKVNVKIRFLPIKEFEWNSFYDIPERRVNATCHYLSTTLHR